jgi:hypothetical protein
MNSTKRQKTVRVFIYNQDGATVDWQPILPRAPIKPGIYSPAERYMLLELGMLYYIDKNKTTQRNNVYKGFKGELERLRCTKLLIVGERYNSVNLANMVDALVKCGLLNDPSIPGRFIEKPLEVSQRGWRHIKRQSERLRKVAQKLVYTDVLDRIARA